MKVALGSGRREQLEAETTEGVFSQPGIDPMTDTTLTKLESFRSMSVLSSSQAENVSPISDRCREAIWRLP